MNKIMAVARYEFIRDIRNPRTYFIFFMIGFIAFGYSYIIPEYANGLFFYTPGGSDEWLRIAEVPFVTIVAGLLVLFTGGLMSVDTLSGEFENNTLSRLISLPVKRLHVYSGKYIEKIFIFLIFSVIFITIELLFSYILYGNQSYLQWLPLIVVSLVLMFTAYGTIGFFLGSAIRQTGLMFGILIGLWFLSLIIYGLLTFRVHFSIYFMAVPFVNSANVPGSLFYYIINPKGILNLPLELLGKTVVNKIYSWKFVLSNVIFSLLEIIIMFFSGLIIFKRSEVK